jgi:putative ABC transport system permease protein
MTVTGLLLTALIVGSLSGVYPAMILSSFRPSTSLRANRSTVTRGAVKARNMLVVFQTAVTVCLIVATTVVYAQLTYFRDLDRGFDSDQLLVVQEMSRNGVLEKRESFREEVTKIGGVTGASLSYESPTKFYENNTRVWIPGESEDLSYPLGATNVDVGYLEVLGIPLLAGRFYQKDRALDQMPSTDELGDGDVLQANMVVNARAVEVMGLGTPRQAIGRQLETRYPLDDGGMAKVHLTIIGVIGNTNLHSAKTTVRPEIYRLQSYYHHLLVRYSADSPDVLARIQNTWLNMMPGEPFEYFYVQQALAEEFQSEVNQANIFLGFSLLTMMVGCLGLYGLAAFVTECRRREIGIRKIMGARVWDILSLLFGQFSRLVVVANIIAWPVAYFLMTDWLLQYPFRIGNGWIMAFCVIAGLLASFVVALTVGSQAWGVARANPIHAIRQE